MCKECFGGLRFRGFGFRVCEYVVKLYLRVPCHVHIVYSIIYLLVESSSSRRSRSRSRSSSSCSSSSSILLILGGAFNAFEKYW